MRRKRLLGIFQLEKSQVRRFSILPNPLHLYIKKTTDKRKLTCNKDKLKEQYICYATLSIIFAGLSNFMNNKKKTFNISLIIKNYTFTSRLTFTVPTKEEIGETSIHTKPYHLIQNQHNTHTNNL